MNTTLVSSRNCSIKYVSSPSFDSTRSRSGILAFNNLSPRLIHINNEHPKLSVFIFELRLKFNAHKWQTFFKLAMNINRVNVTVTELFT